ncbi:MAG: hypothetical protein JWM20_170 [Patescibacteria group bacterium]|nr:hypothetical protein [Patescibacteria group bacterium]
MKQKQGIELLQQWENTKKAVLMIIMENPDGISHTALVQKINKADQSSYDKNGESILDYCNDRGPHYFINELMDANKIENFYLPANICSECLYRVAA